MEPMNCGASLQQGIFIAPESEQLPLSTVDASKYIPSISEQREPPQDTEVKSRRANILNDDDFDKYRKQVTKELADGEKVKVCYLLTTDFWDLESYTLHPSEFMKKMLLDAGIEQSKIDGLILSVNKPFIFDHEINTVLLNIPDYKDNVDHVLFLAHCNSDESDEEDQYEIKEASLGIKEIPIPVYAERYLSVKTIESASDENLFTCFTFLAPVINTDLYCLDQVSSLFASHFNQVNEILSTPSMDTTDILGHIRSIYADPTSHVEGQLFTTMKSASKSASEIERAQLDEARHKLEKDRMAFNRLTAQSETKKQELLQVTAESEAKKQELLQVTAESETKKQELFLFKAQLDEANNALHESSRKLEEQSKQIQYIEQMTCVVCFTEKRNMVFMPCRHLNCCETCSETLNNCPICRTTITNKIKCIYS